jgi:hypothetical protein
MHGWCVLDIGKTNDFLSNNSTSIGIGTRQHQASLPCLSSPNRLRSRHTRQRRIIERILPDHLPYRQLQQIQWNYFSLNYLGDRAN